MMLLIEAQDNRTKRERERECEREEDEKLSKKRR
jgi:hypothetical protein